MQVVKMGVQYSLWGGSVLNLGTSKHRQRFFDDINMFRAPGCFAMTELKHGSNVAMLQTQAVFDVATDEWVISTPDEGRLHARSAFCRPEITTESLTDRQLQNCWEIIFSV